MNEASPPELRDRIVREFLSLAQIHAMFGEWLDPLARDEWKIPAANLEEAVRRTLKPWQTELAIHRRKLEYEISNGAPKPVS
jgi:hypothetical protein